MHHYIEEHPLWKYDESDFEDEEEEGEGEQTNGHEEHDSNGNEEQLVNYLDDEDDDQEVEDIVGNGKHVRTSLEEVEDQDLTNASDQVRIFFKRALKYLSEDCFELATSFFTSGTNVRNTLAATIPFVHPSLHQGEGYYYNQHLLLLVPID